MSDQKLVTRVKIERLIAMNCGIGGGHSVCERAKKT